jgi:hypothetical protein
MAHAISNLSHKAAIVNARLAVLVVRLSPVVKALGVTDPVHHNRWVQALFCTVNSCSIVEYAIDQVTW